MVLNMFKNKLISIVVPVYNEAIILSNFHQRLTNTLQKLEFDTEILYVNDGSEDESLDILYGLQASDPTIALVDLSRNFGKEIATTAGLDHASGDAVILIDADLQDPPELIPTLIQQWQKGYDVVYAERTKRHGETWFKKVTAYLFYRLIRKLSSITIPADSGDFRLLSRRAIEALKKLRERHRYMKGLFAWIGYPQIAVPFERDARTFGVSKWNYWKLWNLAIDGITSFTIAPLKLATYLGLTTAIIAFLYAMVIIYKTLVFGEPVQGYPSLMVAILFLGGIQLLTMGIIGEYLGRIFDESKQRPLYFVKNYLPSGAVLGTSEEMSRDSLASKASKALKIASSPPAVSLVNT